MVTQTPNLERERSIPEIYAEGLRYFMGEGTLNRTLARLVGETIELKLALGTSAPDRLKDLADVQELIKIRKLGADFAPNLDPYVREKYLELEAAVRNSESNQEK